jgi:hypothetical protein
VSNGEGGLSIDDQRLEASLMYQAKNHWSRYPKKMERELWESLKTWWYQPWTS